MLIADCDDNEDKDNGVDNNDNIDDLFENLIMLSRSSPFPPST